MWLCCFLGDEHPENFKCIYKNICLDLGQFLYGNKKIM